MHDLCLVELENALFSLENNVLWLVAVSLVWLPVFSLQEGKLLKQQPKETSDGYMYHSLLQQIYSSPVALQMWDMKNKM